MNYDELFVFDDSGYKVKDYLRKDDPSITDIKIPSKHMGKKIWLIKPHAFENARYIRTVHLPKSVTALATKAFAGCTSLESVHISSNKLTMFSGIFCGCTSLKSIVLPQETYIKFECFMGCTSLEEVTVLGGTEKVPFDAFRDCVSLKKVTLPETLKLIERTAFINCPSLESLTIKSQNVKAEDGGGLFGCPRLSAETLFPFAVTTDEETGNRYVNTDLILSRADIFDYLFKKYKADIPPEQVIGKANISLLPIAAEHNMFTKENIDGLVELSVTNGSAEVTAWLLEYKKQKFGFNGGETYEL